ncbi:MAG: hypothetical protein A4E52_01194 [Pelotomaculum sp. PtaB.Bin013]|uniref:Uncharacterized protein n=1 Tax=Pelotomaculum isophthalicicum JI TaxID=947010 RepID=A0A9X4H6U5_9FIRM|nr:hypothetical protein [Pelotomaculum isophthalicicum]MDF9407159.1 hypothetical protein [Pelotomaculum isophthalicicum JI]OPX88688.1 MAG: hypothetical protein A4E52_01194 [Pelotomaculum sp. PtaB.Bin013]
MVKETMAAVEAMKETMGVLDCSKGGSKCSAPNFVFFIFKDAKCVNIFNGACETWDPGDCADNECD